MQEAAIDSNKLWESAGKPRQGPIFNKRQLCRAQYRKAVRDGEKRSTLSYTNDLHEALLSILKMGQLFGNAGVLSSKLARIDARNWVAALSLK